MVDCRRRKISSEPGFARLVLSYYHLCGMPYFLVSTVSLWVFRVRPSILIVNKRTCVNVRLGQERCKAMASPLDFMVKPTSTTGGTPPRPSRKERRASRRCKITQLMRIRPSDPEREPFDDIRGSLSMSRSGVYFQSSEPGYELGMRL